MSSAAAGSAAAAAAEAKRKREEEEEMTPYGREELSGEWEFKILRSTTGAFKKPEFMHRVLDEEAQAGWVLVEKFDNARLRLKRRAGANQAQAQFGVDPYRSYVGPSEGQFALIIVVCTLAGMAVIGAIIALIAALD